MDKFTEERLLDILESAIKDELKAQMKYFHGARIADNEDVKNLFRELAEEEKRHERLLRERYQQIKKKLGLKIMSKSA